MESIQQLNVNQLKSRLEQPGDRPVLLDVREDWEFKLCALDGSIHIPVSQVQMRLHQLDRNREIVVVCHHGVRSGQVAHYLAHQGYSKLYNLAGGIDAWAREIDPNMRTY